MIRLTLSKDEILLLQKYIHSPVELIRFKAMTVLARSEEIPLESFATVLNRSERTITRWVKDYSEKGMSSIFSGMIGNQNASGEVINLANPETFAVTNIDERGNFIAHDKSNVFFNNKVLENANPKSVITISPDTFTYIKDSTHVYYDGDLINGLNATGFKYIHNSFGNIEYFYAGDTVANKVFYQGKATSIDLATFKFFTNYGIDKNYVYYKGQPIKELVASLTTSVSDEGVLKDNKNVIFLSDEPIVLQTIDAAKFHQYTSTEAVALGLSKYDLVCGDGTYYYYCNTGNKITKISK